MNNNTKSFFLCRIHIKTHKLAGPFSKTSKQTPRFKASEIEWETGKKYTKSHFIYDVISLWNCVKFLFDEWSSSKKRNSTRTFRTRTNVLFIHEMSFSNKKTHQQTVNILSRPVFKINHKKYKHHIDKETFDSLIEPLLSSPVHRYYRVYIYKKRKIWINLVLNVFLILVWKQDWIPNFNRILQKERAPSESKSDKRET